MTPSKQVLTFYHSNKNELCVQMVYRYLLNGPHVDVCSFGARQEHLDKLCAAFGGGELGMAGGWETEAL